MLRLAVVGVQIALISAMHSFVAHFPQTLAYWPTRILHSCSKGNSMRFFISICALIGVSLQPLFAAAPLTIEYGHVTGIEVTTKESAMARNMVIGSLVGWAVDGSSSGALSGAVAGFAITSLVENDKRVFAYTLNFPDGSAKTIAVDRPDVSIGHCAALEQQGEHVNLRPVSAVHCEDDTFKNDSDEHGGEHRQTAAEKCSEARKTLAEGGKNLDVQAALRNMRAYCD
jgi:hypothetical protein